jgi:hypothetical protein
MERKEKEGKGGREGHQKKIWLDSAVVSLLRQSSAVQCSAVQCSVV